MRNKLNLQIALKKEIPWSQVTLPVRDRAVKLRLRNLSRELQKPLQFSLALLRLTPSPARLLCLEADDATLLLVFWRQDEY
jgi:hypothetical protein